MGDTQYWVYVFEWELEDGEVRHVFDVPTETVEKLRELSEELDEQVTLTHLRLSHGVGREEQTFESVCGHGPNAVASTLVSSPDQLVPVDEWLTELDRERDDGGSAPNDLCGHCWANISE